MLTAIADNQISWTEIVSKISWTELIQMQSQCHRGQKRVSKPSAKSSTNPKLCMCTSLQAFDFKQINYTSKMEVDVDGS